jgi:hypothetical protein
MLILILFFLAQTTSIDAMVSWFASFLPIVLWLFIFIIFVMFIYAVLKAPLDVLRKGMASLSLVLLAAQTTTTTVAPELSYITNLTAVFWGLLGSILIFLLPLLLILLLYKSFLALVKSR